MASVTEGYTPTRIRVALPLVWRHHNGHLTQECEYHHDGGPACPACLAERLPADLPEHGWPWVPRIGPGTEPLPVPVDHR